MSDWFTGSGCVLIKTLIWEAFGLSPDLNGLTVRPAKYFPCKDACINMQIKGCDVTLRYKNTGEKTRCFTVNGEKTPCLYDEKTQTYAVYFTNAELEKGALTIEVCE